MNVISRNDLEFCWSQVLDFDPWFRLHFVFAPKQNATQILALNALIAMLERALTMSEESLVITQLAWWQNELSPRQSASSGHPVVRALRESGALSLLAEHRLDGLVAPALQRLQAEPFRNEEDLRAVCEKIGEGGIRLELALESSGSAFQAIEGHCAATGLARLCALALRNRQPSFWFMPLNIQARHQVQSPVMDHGAAGGLAALRTMRRLGEEWFEDQNRTLAHAISQQRTVPSVRRHLLAMGLTQGRQFSRAMRLCEEGQAGVATSWRLRDFFRIWSDYRALLSAKSEH